MSAVPDDDRKVLFDFFGAYFHQDWALDDETPAAVIACYMRDMSQGQVARLRSAILRLMDSDCDNAALERSLLRDFGCYYLPSADGLTVKEWLSSIIAMLSGNPEPVS